MIQQNNKKVNPVRNNTPSPLVQTKVRISNGVKVLLTGGGTGGSVSPLLAIAEELTSPPAPLLIRRGEKEERYEFLWVGTKNGPEKEMVAKASIRFKAIASGKLRRYFSLKNFIDPIFILIGFVESLFIMLSWRPDLVMTAGSFASVPVVWAAWILRVPILVHQQDMRPGLANKLMAPFANVVTVTFEESLKNYGKKAVWTGNPVGFRMSDFGCRIDEFCKKYGLKKNLPIVLVVGGGTGAMEINKLVWESLDELTKICQIIHITGKGKITNYKLQITNYKPFDFLEHEKVMEIMQAADLVVSRAGLGFLTEISYLGKPAIIIPIPDSHQEDNAQIFAKNEAAIVLDQKKLTPNDFTNKIKELLKNEELRNKLRNNAAEVMKKGGSEAIVKIVEMMTQGSQ
ncbi:MAG: undecaprenyldiphospho-muramoylpentapeptide beta-N-acetylglucosaminyltransferase [Patescibacteria group bacterium]|nr:undecaprenyldiphospho-muramoylpentapeptide beta-N-acetylglucosaminyltransferase [Patescibacteria group bacterium]MDD5295018.1 undecaprenyldiphospho-muramoylpentapeptide beta-N-acetylglucosaminyltransferase [Patescibacteria group bacterium]MDD5554205.1 undecaprenyldiphospho-muramoylpentapeptide beta-N-acetylglucosaminyltransferase [Patescibacteria group bacterium]